MLCTNNSFYNNSLFIQGIMSQLFYDAISETLSWASEVVLFQELLWRTTGSDQSPYYH